MWRYDALLAFFTLSLFVSASLLFWVQPMFTKMVLPLLGGTPAVWNTCLVFYQGALLAGYVYAHVSARWLGVRGQAALHLVWLLLALLVLPVEVAPGWTPPVTANPIPWLFLLLLVAVGFPFFVLSTTAPMLQQWFAHTGHKAARDPYFLYVASNLGAMAALVAYPILLEPHLHLKKQSWAWSLGYGLLALLIAGCAVILWRTWRGPSPAPEPGAAAAPLAAGVTDLEVPTLGRRLMWVALSFAPSSLLLGVTTYITTDIAAVPLLWVIPLALYLLSFVLVFARRPLLSHPLMVRLQPFMILPLAVLFLWGLQAEGNLVLPLHLLAFFLTAMVCHGELAQSRPPAANLTEFYLWLSVGGVLGGMFNALVAPLIFKTVVEYPLIIVLACLLRPTLMVEPASPRDRWLDLFGPAALGLLLAALVLMVQASAQEVATTGIMIIISCVAGMVCYSFLNRPVRFGLGVGVIILAGVLYTSGQQKVLHQERSFFGVLQVRTDTAGQYHMLYHGTTLHGAQSLEAARRREPLTYFNAAGPIGQVFTALSHKAKLKRVAIMGLGTGTLACYAWPKQEWTFYEIDPAVERIARDPLYFTYLKDCPAQVQVVLGDGRLTLAQAPDRHYDLIVFDAFSSDAVPLHLIYREAIRLYLAKLSDHGLLVFNISNRYLDLRPVFGNLAQDAGLVCLLQDYSVGEAEQNLLYVRSVWVVMARSQADLGELTADNRWSLLSGTPKAGVWTDDFSNVLSVFRWPAFKLPWRQ